MLAASVPGCRCYSCERRRRFAASFLGTGQPSAPPLVVYLDEGPPNHIGASAPEPYLGSVLVPNLPGLPDRAPPLIQIGPLDC